MNKIKLLFMDVDGTLTDGMIYMSNQGELMKAFNVKDGYAIHNILPYYDIVPIIITGRSCKILKMRCDEIGIKEIYQGVSNKLEMFDSIIKRYNVSYDNVAYIGDDINDLKCMVKSGISGCPADAVKEVKEISDFVAYSNGGKGAVRDFIEWLCK